MNRPEAKNAMSKKFLNLVSITPVTFTFNIDLWWQVFKSEVYSDAKDPSL